ncbi:hypothetical protein [Verrucomicrobium spinosum]|uniref:hypothetical protein n=1 Tax=Verrucomicrobium spinosum TaxID=2736 RepID=UPI000174666A|nr:hypothetical protein [Verrucomicrobium spinosum]
MEKGQGITFIKGTGSPIQSPTLGQVSVALASGIAFSSDKCLLDTVEDRDGVLHREHVWTFDADSTATFRPNFPAETITLAELVKRFDDVEWCRANPDHPISYMRALWGTRAGLVKRVKERKPLEKITESDGEHTSIVLIPQDATDEERAEMLREFEQARQ